MTDDIISASGLSASFIPPWQKVFWCFTEGLVAIALIRTTGALGSLRALSIVIGLPYTVFLCLMVPACYRVLKKEMADDDILTSYRFNTQLLDILEFFKPKGGSPCTPATHLTHLAQALFIPGLPVFKCYKKLYPDDFLGAVLYSLGAVKTRGGSNPGHASAASLILFSCPLLLDPERPLFEASDRFALERSRQAGFYIAWIVCHILETSNTHSYLVAWLMFFFFLAIVVHLRVEMRQKYNVWGSPVDDLFASLLMYPFVLAQCSMMADTDGKDAPLYFASAEEVIQEMAVKGGEPMPEVASTTYSKATESSVA